MTGGWLTRGEGDEQERLRYTTQGDLLRTSVSVFLRDVWESRGWTVHPDPVPLPTEPGSCGWATIDGERCRVYRPEPGWWMTMPGNTWYQDGQLSDFRPVVFPADPLTAEQDPEAAPRYVAKGEHVYDVQEGKRAPFDDTRTAEIVAADLNEANVRGSGYIWEPAS